MNDIIKQKIKSLYSSGFRSIERIKQVLAKPTPATESVELYRPAYAYEAELYHLLIPNVVTIQELGPLDKKARLDLVQTRLLSMFSAAENSQKANVLALSMRVTALNDRIESSGSAGFSDPNFMQEYSTEVRAVDGPSWLEQNEFSLPSDEDIKLAISE